MIPVQHHCKDAIHADAIWPPGPVAGASQATSSRLEPQGGLSESHLEMVSPHLRPWEGGMPWPAIVLGGIGWKLKGMWVPWRKEKTNSKDARNQDKLTFTGSHYSI